MGIGASIIVAQLSKQPVQLFNLVILQQKKQTKWHGKFLTNLKVGQKI